MTISEESGRFHVWESIELPSSADLVHKSAATREMGALGEAWLLQRERLERESPDALREFLGRLTRSWSIETGILERLYDLDEGATTSLVELGLREELVASGASSLPPGQLVAILRNHEAAAEMVQALVAEDRPLTNHFIRELHALLMQAQDTTLAQTAAGAPVEVALAKGQFKVMPNNPKRVDGLVHEYAPPEQVQSEMDSLLAGLDALNEVDPIVRAAWLHHRFTQIHPFQDGNGRVARALTNYVLIKARLFPLVVSRLDRVRYIEALESADAGDLSNLIDYFAEVVAKTIMEALAFLQMEEEKGRGATVDALFGRLAQKYGQRLNDRQQVLRGVNETAHVLRDDGLVHIERQARDNAKRLEPMGLRLNVLSQLGGPDQENDYWWKAQLIDLANELGYWINFSETNYWFRVTLRNAPVQLMFVASLHHVGQELSGAMRAAAFAEYEVLQAKGEPDPEAVGIQNRIRQNCTPTTFSVTWQQRPDEVKGEFERWLDEAFLMAMRRWLDLF